MSHDATGVFLCPPLTALEVGETPYKSLCMLDGHTVWVAFTRRPASGEARHRQKDEVPRPGPRCAIALGDILNEPRAMDRSRHPCQP